MEHAQSVVETCIALAASGLSRAKIAEQIGMTRSAVCALMWRKGIAPAAPVVKAKPAIEAKPKRPKPVKAKSPQAKPVAATFYDVVQGSKSPGVRWADLDTTSRCCWPMPGDLWCGNHRGQANGSYCRDHFRIAYRGV